MRRNKTITLASILKIIALIAFIVFLRSTTFGWKVTKSVFSSYSKQHEGIAANLKNHVNVLSQEIGWRGIEQYENLQKAENYIAEQFTALGLEVERQEFTVAGKAVSNVIAKKTGTKYPDRIIVAGAHYDSYFNPGADGNASGVAAILELARLLAGQETGATVHLVAFATKEPPFFGTPQMGSVFYAKRLKENNETVLAVFILDAIGYYSGKNRSQRYPPLLGITYPDKGNFLAVIGNSQSAELLKTTESTLKKEASIPIQSFVGFDFINSDHWAFWKEKYDTVLLTDTGGYRNPHHYSLSDTPEELNYLSMAQLVRGLVSVLEDLAK